MQIVRSVQQHNVWQLMLTMVTLTPMQTTVSQKPQAPGKPTVTYYIVKRGDTLTRLAAAWAGPKATHARREQVLKQIIALTAKYGKDDITKKRKAFVYLPADNVHPVGQTTVKRNEIVPGERLVRPA